MTSGENWVGQELWVSGCRAILPYRHILPRLGPRLVNSVTHTNCPIILMAQNLPSKEESSEYLILAYSEIALHYLTLQSLSGRVEGRVSNKYQFVFHALLH